MFGRPSTTSLSRSPRAEVAYTFDARSRALLVQFSYLQLLDILTTLVFLTMGVREVNPIVRFAMAASPSPIGALLLLKLGAVVAAVYCSVSGRTRVLFRINVVFAALVVWNLIAILGK